MNNDTKHRIVRTSLYSKIAAEILQSVEGQLSDGMWENSPGMEKYWRFSGVTTAPDGEILIEISTESGKFDLYSKRWRENGFYGMSDASVYKWFADKVKQIAKAEMKDEEDAAGWKRDNTAFETRYLSRREKITVADAYFVYEYLLGRNTTGKYPESMRAAVRGEPLSEEKTNAEKARRAAVDALTAEIAEARRKLDAEKAEKIRSVEAEFKARADRLNAEFKARYEALRA